MLFLLLLTALLALPPSCRRAEEETEAKQTSRTEYNAGFQIIDVPAGDNGTITTAVWYPTKSEVRLYAYGSRESANRGTVAVDAELAGDDHRFPLLLYSHGFGGSGIGATYLTEFMARRGWIVVAPDHHDPVNLVRIRTGRREDVGLELFRKARKLVETGTEFDFDRYAYRDREARTVMDHVLGMKKFSGRIDRDRLAIGGHSFGGYTALRVCGALGAPYEPAFKAILLHSPGIWMFETSHFRRIDRPVLFMLGENETDRKRVNRTKKEWAVHTLNALSAPGYYVEVADGNHFSFNTAQRAGFLSRMFSGTPEQFETIRHDSRLFLEHHRLGRTGGNTSLRQGHPGRSDFRTFSGKENDR